MLHDADPVQLETGAPERDVDVDGRGILPTQVAVLAERPLW